MHCVWNNRWWSSDRSSLLSKICTFEHSEADKLTVKKQVLLQEVWKVSTEALKLFPTGIRIILCNLVNVFLNEETVNYLPSLQETFTSTFKSLFWVELRFKSLCLQRQTSPTGSLSTRHKYNTNNLSRHHSVWRERDRFISAVWVYHTNLCRGALQVCSLEALQVTAKYRYIKRCAVDSLWVEEEKECRDLPAAVVIVRDTMRRDLDTIRRDWWTWARMNSIFSFS